MLDVDDSLVLALLTVAAVAYFLVRLVPRVDVMERSYRKFIALTTLGISYLILLTLLLTIVAESSANEPVGLILGLSIAAFLLFGLTLLGEVFDDWLRLFADPEFNTWVELSMVLAVFILLLIVFWLSP
ncbi:MAG: hypothetical protein ACOC42_02325 [Halobacteriota archaeon]